MLKLKNLFLFVMILISGYNFAISQMQQGMPNAEERAKFLTERLKVDLKLENKQIPKVNEILLKYSKKVDSLRNQTKSRQEMMEIMKKNMKEQDNEIKNVLTKEQFKKYEKIMEENRNRMRKRD
ncbi:MAG: hypothetical protein IGBAC_2197 [Ignavibacteriae bacterium]|nr:MAG: hypothetical protein IGBAC_2197 [Ignavibacteriota bacterium]